MKKLTQYTYSATNAMFNYMRDEDLDALIKDLRRIEDHAKKNLNPKSESQEMWFKFGEDDTLATSISEIKKDLSSLNNRRFTIERFVSVCGLVPSEELEVYFS